MWHYGDGKKLTERVARITENSIEQALTLRRHYLPNESDDERNLARALWLDKHFKERQEIAVNNGVVNVLNNMKK